MKLRNNYSYFAIARGVFAISLFVAASTVLFAEDTNIAPVPVSDLYAQFTGGDSTASSSRVPVTGLKLYLPAATTAAKFALVTLNMPNLYFTGTPETSGEALAGQIWVILDGKTNAALGQVSNEVAGQSLSPRHDSTLVVKVLLLSSPQSVTAEWNVVNGGVGGNIVTDTFASISAVLTTN